MHHKRESVAMLSSIFPDKRPFIATTPRKPPALPKRSCASLLSATMLMSLSGLVSTPVIAQQQKPNILFIMGDDIGLYQPIQGRNFPASRRDAASTRRGDVQSGKPVREVIMDRDRGRRLRRLQP